MSKVGDPTPLAKCEWVWPGVMPWELVEKECDEETTCAAPTEPGGLIGETEFTDCGTGD